MKLVFPTPWSNQRPVVHDKKGNTFPACFFKLIWPSSHGYRVKMRQTQRGPKKGRPMHKMITFSLPGQRSNKLLQSGGVHWFVNFFLSLKQLCQYEPNLAWMVFGWSPFYSRYVWTPSKMTVVITNRKLLNWPKLSCILQIEARTG